MVDIACDESILFKLATVWPEEVHTIVEQMLTVVKVDPSAEHFVACENVPDEAPVAVKNAVTRGEGKCFRVGVELPTLGWISFDWFEPNDRSMIFFWDIQHPAEIVPTD